MSKEEVLCYVCLKYVDKSEADLIGVTIVNGEEIELWWCGCEQEDVYDDTDLNAL